MDDFTLTSDVCRTNIGTRILIVDDEPSLRLLVTRVLRPAGFAVTEAAGGAEAIAALAERRFALILLDVAMPVVSGADVFAAARAQDPAQCVVVMTGNATGAGARALLAAGALGVVEKPFVALELLAAVARALASEPPATEGAPRSEVR
jgi:two-component system response regulator PilR (NtrC family)